MSFTTTDFVEQVEFSYFETYSFQRKGKFEVYENLLKRYAKEEHSLPSEELIQLKNLRASDLYINNFILAENGTLNVTSELIYRTAGYSALNNSLVEIFKIPFVDYEPWMCAPIYRDAILFYDSNAKLVDGLNICFQCLKVVTLKHKEVLTDQVAYGKLKEFLQSLGTSD